MANIPSRRAWNVAIISGLCAALLGVVALVIDTLQGDAMNWAVLPAIGAGLLVALLALAQLKKT